METFYKMGIVCFFVIALMNTITLWVMWDEAFLSAKVASIAGIVFYAGLSMFFNYLLNMTRPEITNEYASEDVEDIIKAVKEGTYDKPTRIKKTIKKSKPKTSLS